MTQLCVIQNLPGQLANFVGTEIYLDRSRVGLLSTSALDATFPEALGFSHATSTRSNE